MMNPISVVLAAWFTYLAYQWGSGHKKQPHGAIVFIVMALSIITTIPAYYIGRSKRSENVKNA